MKLLIFSIYSNYEEIISSLKIYHQNINEDVYFINCSNSLEVCDINYKNDLNKCFECIIDKFSIFNLANIPENKFIEINNYKNENIYIPDFNTFEDLKKFEYDNINFGSYICDICLFLNINISTSKSFINKLLNQSIDLYNKISKILDEIKPDKFYIYKKNNCMYNPIIELILKKNIETILFSVNNNIVNFYNAKNKEKLDYSIFIEKINNEYLFNGQKIKKTIYQNTKKEILKITSKSENDLFIDNAKKLNFLKGLENLKFWDEEEIYYIKNKVNQIELKLDNIKKQAHNIVKITACIIVKNEEKNIQRCLESIKDIVNEIVVLDTGCTDKTIEIVEKYNAKVYNYTWKEDFSDARNTCISYSNNDWILIIDADEELEKNTARNILLNIYDNPIFNQKMTFWFKIFHIYPNEQESTFHFRASLFNKKYGFKFKGKIHEHIIDPNNQNQNEISKKHCQDFIINHYCDHELDKKKFEYYCSILEKELKESKDVNDRIFNLIYLSNEYSKMLNNDKALSLLLEAYNLFQENSYLKNKLSNTYISNLSEISYQLIFNYSKFKEASKYVDEIFKITKNLNYPDILYLKALIEQYNNNNYIEAINIYNILINGFKKNIFSKQETYELNSRGKTLYPFCVIELYKLYIQINNENLAINTLLNNENNYFIINMFIIKHFILRNDLKNSANFYFKNKNLSIQNKDNLYNLLKNGYYNNAFIFIIDELIHSNNIFSEYEKNELILKKNAFLKQISQT